MVRPVLYATFIIDRSLYGLHPAGYHLLNLLLHLGSGLLLYRILTSVLSDKVVTIPLWTVLLFLILFIATYIFYSFTKSVYFTMLYIDLHPEIKKKHT